MDFKTRLKHLRKEKKITQGTLAKALNYGYTAVSNYESGRNEPSINDLIKIAEYFGVTVGYLIGVEKRHYTCGDAENITPIWDIGEEVKVGKSEGTYKVEDIVLIKSVGKNTRAVQYILSGDMSFTVMQ